MESVRHGEVPRYRDLPVLEGHGAPHAWGVFGTGDEIGRLNLLGGASLVAAVQEVQRGVTFNITLPVSVPDPPWAPRRYKYDHHVFDLLQGVQDDYLDNFYLQGSTQWDGLRHVGAGGAGYYGGTTAADAGPRGSKLGIDKVAQRGIIGRGVLADVERHERSLGHDFDRIQGTTITVDMLEATLAAQGSTLTTGDILLLRTGFIEAYLEPGGQDLLPEHPTPETSDDVRAEYTSALAGPGLDASAEMAEFLWDHGVVAIAADNPAVEVYPGDRSADWLHMRLIPLLGFTLGEFFVFSDLAADCASDGRYSCLVVAVPLNLPGGVGSPGNAVVLK